jgi:hypothetical protein
VARLTDEQKRANRVERKRAALEDKAFAAVGGRGSLFAELVEVPTAADALEHIRRAKVASVIHEHQSPIGPGVRGLEAMQRNCVEQFARQVFGAEAVGRLLARIADRTPEMAYGFWCRLLTGAERQIMEYRREDAPELTLGYRVVPAETIPAAGFVPPLTKEQFYERFPYKAADLGPEPETADDLFDAVMTDLKQRCEG